MLYERIKVIGISGYAYNFTVHSIEELKELEYECIYILALKETEAAYRIIHKEKCKSIKVELSTDLVKNIILKEKPTHIFIKRPFSTTGLEQQWQDIKYSEELFIPSQNE